MLVVVVLIFFLYDLRSGLIVAVTIPLALLIAFICLDLRHIPANLLSIGAIDFGILVDGAVVMVENIYRQLARRHGTDVSHPRRHPRRGVRGQSADRLRDRGDRRRRSCRSTRSPDRRRKLFRPMADTTIYALLGVAGAHAHRRFPCSASWVLRGGVKERRNRPFEWIRDRYATGLDWCLAHRTRDASSRRSCVFAVVGRASPYTRGGEFMPKLDEGALWVRATMPYTISFEESSQIVPQMRAILQSFPEVTDGRVGARPRRRRHRSDRILQRRVLRRAQAVRRMERRVPLEGRADRRDAEEAVGVSRASPSTTRSRPRTRSTKR